MFLARQLMVSRIFYAVCGLSALFFTALLIQSCPRINYIAALTLYRTASPANSQSKQAPWQEN